MEGAMKAKAITITLLLISSLWLSGCEQEGPAESAGEEMDRAMEDMGESMEDAGDRAEEATD